MRKLTVGIVLFLCGWCLNLKAESEVDAVGQVLDDAGAPLVGALVQLEEGKYPIQTDHEGFFRVTAPSTGLLKVKVSYMGFQTQTFILKTHANSKKTNVLRLQPDAIALNHVVVTATRTPKNLKDAPVVTRVITAQDIKMADATNIQDLLTAQMPGLEFGCAMSQETTLSMNGLGGNAVLFLVDGERMAGETMDNVDFSRLNLDNVGSIEIVKGAASALYGANAVAGVVNLISRENSEPWTVKLNSQYKDFGRAWRYGGTGSFNLGKWNSQTSLQRTQSQAVHLTSPYDTESKVLHIYGGETWNVKERLTFTLSDRVKLIGRGSYFARISRRNNYDDHYKDYAGGLKAVMQLSDESNLEMTYGFDQYNKMRFVNEERTHDHDYTNRQHNIRGIYSHNFNAHTLTAGAELLHDYLATYQFADGKARSQQAIDAFAQFDYNPMKRLNVVASVRHDYFSASNQHATTARLAVMAKWKHCSLRANYAGGFRAPTLKEMYMNFDMAGMQMIYGNPHLKPERSHNFNIAVEHIGRLKHVGCLDGQYSLTLMGHYTKYNRRITTTDFEEYIPGEGQPEMASKYCNESGVTVCGIDLSAQYRSELGFGAKLDYCYLNVGNRSLDSQFAQPRPHTATWRIDYDRQLCSFYRLNVALSGRFLSEPDTKIPEHDSSYHLWKLVVQQRLFDVASVNLNIDNLLGYKPKVYYWSSAMTTGRSFAVGVTLDIDNLAKKW